MTFPGESISVDHFVNVSGSAVGSLEAVQLRAGSSTFGVGDSVRLSSDLLYQYLGPTDAADVSWVVEVLSGSGTFTLSEGIGNTATSLGSHTVSGPTTLVVPSSAIDVGNVYADTDARLLLTCTAGTVVVQQVKLRVWPPEGVAGGWSSTYPSWEGESAVQGREVQRSTDGAVTGAGSATDAWSGAFAAAQTHTNEPWDVGTGVVTNTGALVYRTLGAADVAVDFGTGTFGGDVSMSDLWAVAVNRPTATPMIDPSLGLVDGVDYIIPPTEVAWDNAYTVNAAGTVGREWINAAVSVSGSTTGGTGYGAPTLSVAEYTDTAAPFVTLPITAWPDTTATTLLPGENTLDLPDADQLLFAASFTWLTDTPEYPGGDNVRVDADWLWALGTGGDPEATDLARLGVRFTYPPYRVWSPTAAPKQHPHLIFQRSDGLGAGAKLIYKQDTRQSTGTVYSNY